MKTFNKIMACLMLVASISTNANNINSRTKEELINAMSNDDNVAKYIGNGFKLIIYGTIAKHSPNKISNEDFVKGEKAMSGILEDTKNSLNRIYADYPELNMYSKTERQSIFTGVLNESRTAAKVAVFFNCFGTAIIAVPTCISSGIAGYKKWAYSACMAAAEASQLAVLASDPAVLVAAVDTGVEVELITIDAEACGEVVSTGATAAKITGCVSALSVAVGVCVSEFLN